MSLQTGNFESVLEAVRPGCDAYIVEPLRYVEPYAVTERHLLEPEQAAKEAVPSSRSHR